MICENCGEGCQDSAKDIDTKALDKCPKCGADRIDNGKFCINCGLDFEKAEKLNAKEQAYNTLVENNKSNNVLQVIAKLYRYLLPVMLLVASIICFWGLSKPVIMSMSFGESRPITESGWLELSREVNNIYGVYSMFLLGLAVLCAVYGIIHLVIAIKKPYLSVKKSALWIIDFLICAMLIALGSIVKVMETEYMEMDGYKFGVILGEGYVACIVIGVLGMVLLALRIFYEVKLFKWQDTGLEYSQIADIIEKKKAKNI